MRPTGRGSLRAVARLSFPLPPSRPRFLKRDVREGEALGLGSGYVLWVDVGGREMRVGSWRVIGDGRRRRNGLLLLLLLVVGCEVLLLVTQRLSEGAVGN